MIARLLYAAVLASVIAVTAACGRSAPSSPAIRLSVPDSGPAFVEVVGLSSDVLDTLEDAGYTNEQWTAVLRVSVAPDAPPMLGTYDVNAGAVRFRPAFPLDPGRQYQVRLDLSGVEAGGSPAVRTLDAAVGLPAPARSPSTVVARVYPTGDVVPENWLRMYIEFSGPMGRRSGIEHLKLLDEKGQEIKGAFLPLDYEFWSPDHTRFTAFFDPGRVKDGILPNRQMGRPLQPERTVTLVISREWLDEHGQPLKEEYRRALKVGPPDDQPLDPSRWRIQPPPAGGRESIVVTFPEPLDHGLLMRALGVLRGDDPVHGDIAVEAGETRWRFTPKEAWRAGDYQLLALDILEDLAGNQIGRAFEVDNFDTVDKSPDPQTIRIPFRVNGVG
jgi:hypothetical protein